MQDIVEHPHFLDPSVNDGFHYLPQELKKPYPSGVYINFGDQE